MCKRLACISLLEHRRAVTKFWGWIWSAKQCLCPEGLVNTLWRYFLVFHLDCSHENRGVFSVILKSWMQLLFSGRGLRLQTLVSFFYLLMSVLNKLRHKAKQELSQNEAVLMLL